MGECLLAGPPIGWFNLAGRSTITGLIVSKTQLDMLEAYKKNKILTDLEKLLPEDAEAVKRTLENSLKEESPDSLTLLILARSQALCEEPGEAKHTLETLISREPDHVPAKFELAKILFKEDDLQTAIKHLVEATSMRPDIDENWLLLSEYLHSDGQLEASSEALQQYNMIKAFNEKLKLAEEAFAIGAFAKADKICRHLLGLVPDEVRTLRMLARIAKRFRHFEISTSILGQCIETQPANAALGLEYVQSLLAGRKHREALEQCERLIGFVPENIGIYELKAEALYSLGRYFEARAIYRELSNVHEKRASSLLPLGKVLKAVGETPAAISCFHEAMEDKRVSPQAFWELANLRTYHFSADEIAAMQALLTDPEITAINKVLIQFALGSALEDEGQFVESFQYYQAANSAYTEIQPVRYLNQNPNLKSFFTAEYFSGQTKTGSTSAAPIFVVGLPRSGSTLVEQILTSHSMVDATQELAEIVSIARELSHSNQPGQGQYPQSIVNLSENQIQELAQRYLDYAQTFRQQAPYFVDKAPGNFHHIGLIKTLFPNAKVIDIRRNPMASGWSLYRCFFADSFRFSYDLATIGKYYNEYIELMDHWHTVLPGQILTIHYEELINDLSVTVDRLLTYCGLEFEEACLNFHLNKRAVATPSSEQVRQPLYADALDHWKNYDEFLAPLKDAIGSK
jgi:tetratricopeptide (TPR) repeat protein